MRTALVTGASRGIGHGIAFDLARQGFGLTVNSRSKDDLVQLAVELEATGSPRVVFHEADLSDPDALRSLAHVHAETFATMDALVLSGGIGTGGPFETIPANRVSKTMAINLTSTITLTQHALPLLRLAAKDSPHGARVVMLASITGVYAEPGLAVYGATKAAMISLAAAVNAEESGNGVMVSAVAPAYVDTDMAAYVTSTIPAETMIPVADVAAVVRMLLDLDRNTSVPLLVLSRSGTDGFVA